MYDIYAGVYLDKKDNVIFDWGLDDEVRDIIEIDKDTSGEFNQDGVRYIYGYQYTAKANGRHKQKFRQYIKDLSSAPADHRANIRDFVEWGVLRLDDFCRFSDFKAVVSVKPSKYPSVVNIMGYYIRKYIDSPFWKFQLIKRLCADVEFDVEKAIQVMREYGRSEDYIQDTIATVSGIFNDCKANNELFTMKKYFPRELRDAFSNFLMFKSEEERDAYESLQGVNVLIYDDLYTSGATVREVIKCLRSIHDKNTLTVFTLIKQ
jgi:hypothetical protein